MRKEIYLEKFPSKPYCGLDLPFVKGEYEKEFKGFAKHFANCVSLTKLVEARLNEVYCFN